MVQSSHLLVSLPIMPVSQLCCILAGPGQCGEVLDPLWSAPEQEALLADLHPHSGGPAELLDAGPRQCGLAHHDSAAGRDGVCHRGAETAPLRPD